MPISWLTGSHPGLDEPSAVAYSEKKTYPQKEAYSGTVKLRCRWSQADGIAANILSNYHAWPYPSILPMWAQSAVVSPLPQQKTGADGAGNLYDWAIIDLVYGWYQLKSGVTSPADGDPITESLTPSGEMIKLKAKDKAGHDLYSLGPSPNEAEDWLTAEEGPTKLIIGYDYNIKWEKYTGTIPTQLLTLIDHVNNAAVTSPTLGITFATETLLLTASNITQVITPTGISKSLSINYSWRQNTWNKHWRPRTQTWEYMYFHPSSGATPVIYKQYPPGNFAPITI